MASAGPILRSLRHRWWVVILLTAVTVGAATAALTTVQKKYTANAQLFVAAAGTTGPATSSNAGLQALYAGGLFTQDRVQSYVDIIANSPVTTAAIRELGLRMTPSQLAGEISVDAPANTVLINVHVTDPSPPRAQRLATTVAQQFIAFDASLEGTGGATPVRISLSQPATLPTSPSSPHRSLDLGIALLVGLALGIGIAVALDAGDTRIRNVEDLAAVTSAPLLAVVPFDRRAAKGQRVLDSGDRSVQAESFRQLRTSVRFSNVDEPPKALVVTSPLAKDGKTSTACNLAVVYAESGARVLLVDADLRAPRVAQYFGVDPAPGLTDWLAAVEDPLDLIQTVPGHPSLGILSSGGQPPNPSELLASQRMRRLIATLTSNYAIVIFDAPPLLPVTDAAVLASACDGVILVTRAGVTSAEAIRRAAATLDGVDARLIGVLFNGVPVSSANRYGGYYAEGYGDYGEDQTRDAVAVAADKH